MNPIITPKRHRLSALSARALCALIAATLLPAARFAHADEGDSTIHSHVFQHRDHIASVYEQQKAEHAEREDVMVRRGLLANRSDRSVTLLGEATGLTSDTPIEFILIGESSGHDYEALAITYAKPSDIHEALEFIGVTSGSPYNPRAMRFAPKGEHIIIDIEWTSGEDEHHVWRAEDLIRDGRSGQALARQGFVFVGSQWLDADGDRVYAADAFDPQSVVSLYNEATTVLDVPGAVAQSTVYGLMLPYEGRQAAPGTLLTIRLTPEPGRTEPRVADVTLHVRAPDQQHIELELRHTDSTGPASAGPALQQVFGALNRLVESGRTPYVELDIDDAVPLHELRALLILLRAFQEENVLVMEPPSPGHPFYRAFLPPEDHRDRARRPSQALELRLTPDDEGFSGTVMDIVDTRARREDPFDADITPYPVSGPAELPDVLARIAHRLPVLLVFVPASATYGDVMEWVRPVQATHPTVYFFLEEEGAE